MRGIKDFRKEKGKGKEKIINEQGRVGKEKVKGNGKEWKIIKESREGEPKVRKGKEKEGKWKRK